MNTVLNKRLTLLGCFGAFFYALSPAILGDEVVRIIQTNYAGSNAHVIDPETNEVLDVIEGVPKAHAAVNHPDGTYYYFANEHIHAVDVVEVATLDVVEQ
ncbi:MAG: hypothetical protein ACR2QQ_14745, partial [Gammaproteobacteria bacterium]